MSRVHVARVGSFVSLEVGGDFAELSPAQARALAAQLLAAAGAAPGGPFECETERTYADEPDRCR